MKNVTIREALEKSGLKQWELAKLLKMSEFTLSRKLREELPEEEQNEIVRIIEEGGQ